MKQYEVNLPDEHGEEWRPAATRHPWGTRPEFASAARAAEAWCEANHSRLDYPVSIEGLRVRSVDQPELVEVFDITVESVPTFRASQTQSVGPAPR